MLFRLGCWSQVHKKKLILSKKKIKSSGDRYLYLNLKKTNNGIKISHLPFKNALPQRRPPWVALITRYRERWYIDVSRSRSRRRNRSSSRNRGGRSRICRCSVIDCRRYTTLIPKQFQNKSQIYSGEEKNIEEKITWRVEK